MNPLKKFGFIAVSIFLMLFAACGGDKDSSKNNNQKPPVNISITTQTVRAYVGGSATIPVTTQNTDFTVSASPAGLACVKNGSNIVCTPSASGTYTVTATATADTSKNVSAIVTVPEMEILAGNGQTLYADVTESAAIEFNAAGNWAATATDNAGGVPSWLSLSAVRSSLSAESSADDSTLQLYGSDDYRAMAVNVSGSAGNNAIMVTLQPNDSMADRSATITITTSRGQISVTITQRYIARNGKPYGVEISIAPLTESTTVGAAKTFNVTTKNTDFTVTSNPASGAGCAKNGNTVVCTPTAAGTYTVTVTAAADTAKSASATLTATVAVHTVTFNSNAAGVNIPSAQVQQGNTVSAPAEPTREGYELEGWYSDSALNYRFNFTTAITAPITLYAKWTPKTYTVTFNSNGGSPASSSAQVQHGGTVSAPVPAPTREGYDLEGWYSNSALTVKVTFPYNVPNNIILYANWTKKTYTVTFNANGGSPASSTQSVPHGDFVNAPVSPTRYDYDFDGWYSNAGGTIRFDFDTPITAPITLYANWTQKPRVTSIAITDSSDIALNLEQTKTLNATCQGLGAFACSVIWQSSDINVATVNASGIVKAVGDGVAYITAAWSNDYTVVSTGVKVTARDPNKGLNNGALKPIPMPADRSGTSPVVLDAYTLGGINYFLVDAGQIANTYIGTIIGPFYYPGFGSVTQGRTTLTQQTITTATTETVSKSVTMTQSNGTSQSIGASLKAKFGDSYEFTANTNLTWNWSSSQSGTNSTTYQTSASEANQVAETKVTSLTLNAGSPEGKYRIAMYATSKVYLVVTTNINQDVLLGCEVVVAASGEDFETRLEFLPGPDGIFDNSPAVGTDMIKFANEFYRNLPMIGIVTKTYDLSYANPTATITIPRDIQKAVFVGQYDKGITFNNFNIVVADRGNSRLTIQFENFGMKAGVDTVAVNSASSTEMTINLMGKNLISGGNGTAATASGQSGGNGAAAIRTNGSLFITGGGSADIIGGNGSGGQAGVGYAYNAKSGTPRSGGAGGNGGSGGHGIRADRLTILTTLDTVRILGGSGGTGGDGGYGEGSNGKDRTRAGHAGDGGDGGTGGYGVFLTGDFSINLNQINSLQFLGGAGGSGGRGGNGGDGEGCDGIMCGNIADHGGNGGKGGTGGIGGNGIHFENEYNKLTGSMPNNKASAKGGNGGAGGNGGNGGYAGTGSEHGKQGGGGDGGAGGTALRMQPTLTVTLTLSTSSGGARGETGRQGYGAGKDQSNQPPAGSVGASGATQKWQ